MSIHWINFDRLAVYEAGALLLTWLAYVDETEELRSRVHASLCACALRAMGESDTEWATSPQIIKPIYLLQRTGEINRSLRQLKRRLRDRMIAARMAYPFLQEANSGEVPKLPAAVKRLSINAVSELVLDDAGQTDPENVETRIWQPSLPVIHLASAVHGYLHLVEGVAEPTGLGPLMVNRDAIEYVVRNAEHYESLVATSERLRLDPERLIKFRLAIR